MSYYSLIQEQKSWGQDLINQMPNGNNKTFGQQWLNQIDDSVTDQQINAFVGWFLNTEWNPQVQEYSLWLKGGDRPPRPPHHP